MRKLKGVGAIRADACHGLVRLSLLIAESAYGAADMNCWIDVSQSSAVCLGARYRLPRPQPSGEQVW